MAHPELTKSVPYEFEVLHAANKDGVPVAVPLTKATFAITAQGLELAEKQQPILPAGKLNGKPGESSYRYEPEYAYYKPNTDVVLIANATPPGGADVQTLVEFSLGPLQKRAIVWGDRFWYRGFLGPSLTSPEPFSEMPMLYERAFGGWDRSAAEPDRHRVQPQNPVGVGYQLDFEPGQDRLPLPNVEDPNDMVQDMTSRPNPVGFGFTNPDWQPRAAFAGTFDKAWEDARAPLLPTDFDERFFNAASPGLIANGYLKGDETVRAMNCARQSSVQFDLPNLAPPLCRLRIAGRPDVELLSQLDTIVVNLTESLVTLTWRCHVQLPRGPEQLREIFVGPSQ